MKEKDCSDCIHNLYRDCPLSTEERLKITDENPYCPAWEDDGIEDFD